MNNIQVFKETTLTVEKKPFVPVLSYLGLISLQTRTMLKTLLKDILNCCKMHIVFENKTRLGDNFHFKDRIPKDLTSSVVYKFQCGLYVECVRHFNVRIGEHIDIRH